MIAHQQRLLLPIDFQHFVHRLRLHAVSLPHALRVGDEQLLAALHLAADYIGLLIRVPISENRHAIATVRTVIRQPAVAETDVRPAFEQENFGQFVLAPSFGGGGGALRPSINVKIGSE